MVAPILSPATPPSSRRGAPAYIFPAPPLGAQSTPGRPILLRLRECTNCILRIFCMHPCVGCAPPIPSIPVEPADVCFDPSAWCPDTLRRASYTMVLPDEPGLAPHPACFFLGAAWPALRVLIALVYIGLVSCTDSILNRLQIDSAMKNQKWHTRPTLKRRLSCVWVRR
jgi:hypothetical protein